MGLFCSKDQKQTANVSPTNDDIQKNNGDLEKKETDGERVQTPQPPNENQPQEAREEEAPVVAAPQVEETFERAHQSLARTPAINHDDSVNSTRIAFVGAIESGKSTICQQIKIYCKQHPHDIELQHRPAYINDFLFISMDRLIKLMNHLGLKFSDSDNTKYADIVQSNLSDRRGRPLMPHELDALAILWEDAGIQEAYNHRGEINMNDSVKYFFNCIDRIADLEYVPTMEDLIMLYIPTVGIIHYVYEINGGTYSIYDVSGRMLERKKWLGFYDGFDAVIFTIAISEFDQCYETESGKHSRLAHALDLLEETSSDEIFKSTPLFLFLNEVDIFKEKLSILDLKTYFPDYTGSSDKDALSFMKQVALSRCTKVQPENITVYYTTAINTKKMHKCFNELFKKIGK